MSQTVFDNARPLRIYLPSRKDCQLVSQDSQIINKFELHNFATGRAIKAGSPEEADLIILFQEWSFKLPSYIRLINETNLFKDFSEKIFVINYDDTIGEGFLPGCYTSLKMSTLDRNRFRSCAYPKIYNEFVDAKTEYIPKAKYLFSFMGTKESHSIRREIINKFDGIRGAKIVEVSKAFHSHTPQEKKEYHEHLQSSIFVLCPRGWSPNTYRIFETMSVGRCPVIISDEWVETEGPDWSNCSIRVAEKDIASIPKLLMNLGDEGLNLGRESRKEWNQHFSEAAKYRAYLDQITDLYLSNHRTTMQLDEYNKYWRSTAFLRNNDWTIGQRALRKINALLR